MNFKRKLERSKLPHKHPSRNKDPYKWIRFREAVKKMKAEIIKDECDINSETKEEMKCLSKTT